MSAESEDQTINVQDRIDALDFERQSHEDDLLDSSIPSSIVLPIRLLKNQNSVTSRLLGNKLEQNYTRGKSRWFTFEFEEPVYIDSVGMEVSGYPENHRFRVQSQKLDEHWTSTETVLLANNQFQHPIKGLRKGIRIEPYPKYFSEIQIHAVNITGNILSEIYDELEIIQNLDEKKNNFSELCNAELSKVSEKLNQYNDYVVKKNELSNEIDGLEDEIRERENRVASLSESITEAERRVALAQDRESESTKSLERVESDIKVRSARRETLIKQISEDEAHLKKLQADINMFPAQIGGYVTQGSRTAKLYAWLTVIPLSIVIYLGFRLVGNAEDLIRNFNAEPNVNILEVLLSRLPYVTITLTVFFTMLGVITFLLREIVNLNRRKQGLFKINIIATDVVDASANRLNVSDVDAMRELNWLKMEMLRDHLKHTMSDEFFIRNPFGRFTSNRQSNSTDFGDERKPDETEKSRGVVDGSEEDQAQ